MKSAIQNSRSWLSSVVLLLAGGWFAQPAKGALAGPAKLSALILSGDGTHDWRTTTGFLRKLLTDSGRFEVRVNESPAGLTARTLAGFDVVVDDYSGPRLGAEADKALEAFVRAGKGLVVTYGGLAAPAREPGGSRQGLANLTTASWPANAPARDEVPFQLFDLKIVRSEHPVMQGLKSPLRTADMPRRGFTLSQEPARPPEWFSFNSDTIIRRFVILPTARWSTTRFCGAPENSNNPTNSYENWTL